jgi:SAM-dependent methyltransferase
VAAVTGIDVSTGMLDQARVRAQGVANATFQEGAAESMPFANGVFDLVTCRICAHHFVSVPDFLKETRRVLAPGGRLILADTATPDDSPAQAEWQNRVELLRDPSHIQNYTPLMWLSFLAEARLRIEELSFAAGRLPITLEDWLTKSGCQGETAQIVRREFAEADPGIRRAFHIEPEGDADLRFHWMRVGLLASRA